MSYCDAILNEITSFEEMYGCKPKMLIICDIEFRDKFFSEILQLRIQNDLIDLKTPGYFYGVPFEWKNVVIYGGSCKWLFVGGSE